MAKVGRVRIDVINDQQLLRKLDSLPVKIRTILVRKAIGRSTTIMKRELVKRVPVGSGPEPDDRKRLKKSITKRTKLARGKTGVHGVVGVPYEFPKFIFMLHYGIKPHTISAFGRGKGLNLGFGRIYRSVQHPGVRKMDFLRDALAASIPKSRTVFSSQLKTGLASVAK